MAKKVVAIRLSPQQHADLKRLARATAVTVNFLIERCLDAGLDMVKEELQAEAQHGKELQS